MALCSFNGSSFHFQSLLCSFIAHGKDGMFSPSFPRKELRDVVAKTAQNKGTDPTSVFTDAQSVAPVPRGTVKRNPVLAWSATPRAGSV